MKNNKPVFESFNEFIKFVYEADQLNEGETTGYAGKLAGILSGGMKLKGQNKGNTDTLVSDYLNKYYNASVEGTKGIADTLIEDLTQAFETLNNTKISTKSGVVSTTLLPTTFEYLTDGVVKAEGHSSDMDNYSIGSRVDVTETLPLAYVLAAVNAHNFNAFAELVYDATNQKKGDEMVNYGDEAKLERYLKWSVGTANEKYRFFQINPKSLDGDVIQFIDYKPIGTTPGWGWQFPIYVASSIIPGGGSTVDASIYDEVIQPAGNSVDVTEKEYNSSGTNFFEENGVAVSEEGQKALNAILSKYNSIDKILVNGGASSKPTSRKGGNEQLAKDRQAAGIALLNALKKSGVVQLKAAAVTLGTAKVQDAAPTESDPKNQQVSFVISGKIKSTEVVENKPITIEQVEKMRADAVKFTEYKFNILVDAEPNATNLRAV